MDRRAFINAVGKWAMLLFVPITGRAQFATFHDRPYLAGPVPPAGYTLDTFESYSPGATLAGLNGGTNWNAAWVSHDGAGVAYDDFESYSNSTDLNGLNGGAGWTGAFVSHLGVPAPLDSFESYADTADLNGLNGGTDWAGAFVSR
jgi:hypothetical protein